MRTNLEYSNAAATVVRQDAFEKLTGRAVYAFDIVQSGMLHAKLLRSPHAHARVRSINTDLAVDAPGVCTTSSN